MLSAPSYRKRSTHGALAWRDRRLKQGVPRDSPNPHNSEIYTLNLITAPAISYEVYSLIEVFWSPWVLAEEDLEQLAG